MRLAEDMEVADATETGDTRVDLFLGGHDHGVVRRFIRDTDSNPDKIEQGHNNVDIAVDGRVRDAHGKIRIIKSGTDWRGLSLVRIVVHNKNTVTIHLSQYTDILQPAATLTVAPCAPSLARIRQTLTAIHDRVGALVQEPLLHCSIPLEGRGSIVRSQETNLGNMLADALRAFYNTDIAFFNSGAIRCDRVFESTLPAGRPLLVRDIINICPFENPLVVKKISGRVLWQALENSIGDMHMDGRFLQVSGLRLLATWQRPAGYRVLELLLEQSKTTTQIINPEQMYTVAMLSFIARGYDDYTCLSGEETVVSEEGAMTYTELMLQILQGEELEGSPHVLRIKRAREVIVEGVNGPDCLPVVKPRLDGRIRFVECPAV